MAGDVDTANFSVNYYSTDAVISIGFESMFTIFSISFHILVMTDITVILNDVTNYTHLTLAHEYESILCTEGDFLNSTFFCPHQNPRTFHQLRVWGLSPENSDTVSILKSSFFHLY